MKHYRLWSVLLTLIVALTMLFSSLAFAGTAEKAHWGYTGDTGPEHWGELDEKYVMCAKGKNQSPIDLANFIEADLAPIQFNYQTPATEILNNGHTIQVNFPEGNTITLYGKMFELKQFHFHTPSENLIEGKSFAMEAHLVHADKDGNLAVIAVMYDEGEAQQLIALLWEQMPEKAGEHKDLSGDVNAMGLLPEDKDYYRFNGSLTTPPCSEGVWWLVMKQPLTVSKQQVETFAHLMHGANNRPIQPANARPVLK